MSWFKIYSLRYWNPKYHLWEIRIHLRLSLARQVLSCMKWPLIWMLWSSVKTEMSLTATNFMVGNLLNK